MVTAPSRETRFVERTLTNLANAWRDISAGAAHTIGRVAPESGRNGQGGLRELMQECLAARGGEVSARARAAELGRRYLAMDARERYLFFDVLVQEFGYAANEVDAAIERFQGAGDTLAQAEAAAALRSAFVPPRVKLLRQFNALPDGTKFLVDLRATLLRHLETAPHLQPLDWDLKELLTAWFDVGFLSLQRITWHSPAALLEKLIAYEAVHEIRDWNDLRDRLDSDRRCYALFHPQMPEEPLAFIEVALTRKMAARIQHLLDDEAPPDDPAQARAAIFYSISNTQSGLRGITFGDYLIKQVVARLHQEMPRIETFATLSPIPGFRRWLNRLEPAALRALTDSDERRALTDLAGVNDPLAALLALVDRLESGADDALLPVLRTPLCRLCARYFLARRGDGTPLDPVARFHLKNGARLERINWMGDASAKGLRQSAGLMVNYRYSLPDIEANHEAFMRDGRIVLGNGVAGLLRGWKEPDGTPLRRLAG